MSTAVLHSISVSHHKLPCKVRPLTRVLLHSPVSPLTLIYWCTTWTHRDPSQGSQSVSTVAATSLYKATDINAIRCHIWTGKDPAWSAHTPLGFTPPAECFHTHSAYVVPDKQVNHVFAESVNGRCVTDSWWISLHVLISMGLSRTRTGIYGNWELV